MTLTACSYIHFLTQLQYEFEFEFNGPGNTVKVMLSRSVNLLTFPRQA